MDITKLTSIEIKAKLYEESIKLAVAVAVVEQLVDLVVMEGKEL
jgi:hypothetical protein